MGGQEHKMRMAKRVGMLFFSFFTLRHPRAHVQRITKALQHLRFGCPTQANPTPPTIVEGSRSHGRASRTPTRGHLPEDMQHDEDDHAYLKVRFVPWSTRTPLSVFPIWPSVIAAVVRRGCSCVGTSGRGWVAFLLELVRRRDAKLLVGGSDWGPR